MADQNGERVSIVEPVLAEMPWGGRRLAEFGLALPDHVRIGEALATSDSVRISAGFASGKTLGEVVVGDPDACLGNRARAVVGGREIFPLLVKLLDANANLSIQVHPGDDQAASQDRVGKTEAWHVLAAEPGAWLYAGLQDDVQVEEFWRRQPVWTDRRPACFGGFRRSQARRCCCLPALSTRSERG
jgi:mannose-6-phosphate isomerase